MGMVSSFLKPHWGQVIVDCNAIVFSIDFNFILVIPYFELIIKKGGNEVNICKFASLF